ncbi:MAG TPA: hypothetical protein VGD59_00645 [Acidisarcina sp.]
MAHDSYLDAVISVVTFAEPLFTLLALLAFLRAGEQLRFPSLRNFLILRLTTGVGLTVLLNSYRVGVERHLLYRTYFYSYWICYIVEAVAIFLVIQELFKHVMSPLPGISRLGLMAFRWAGTISVIVGFSAGALPAGFKGGKIMVASVDLMRGVSIMELCLVALLAFSVHSLGLSYRCRAFGVGLGFGCMAVTDFLTSAFSLGTSKTLTTVANVVAAVAGTAVLLIWTAYFVIPERERKPLTLPMSSPLMRWNEIATALGHASPQVAVGSTSQFFLQDVEGVVDKMLSKNAMNHAD